MDFKFPKEIKALDNSQPHESWNGWENYLRRDCEIRDKYRGITFFGSVNCNYILFRDGLLIENYGYHGKALMNRLRNEGAKKVRKDITDIHNEIQTTLNKIRKRNKEDRQRNQENDGLLI